MRERIYTYYSGILESQFELLDVDSPHSKSINDHHKIDLVPKFRLFNAKKIDKETFDNLSQEIISKTHIKYPTSGSQISRIDFVKTSISHAFAKQFDQAFLAFHQEKATSRIDDDLDLLSNQTALWENTIREASEISDYSQSLPLTPFLVNNKDHKHGRLHAHAVVRVFEEREVPIKSSPSAIAKKTEIEEKQCDFVDKITLEQCLNKVPLSQRFCENHRNTIAPPIEKGCFSDGCFGGAGSTRRMWDKFLSPLGLDYNNSRGCFGGRNTNPLGCFSSSVPMQSRAGCGIGSLLSLLALMWLLWCLLFGNCGSCNKQANQVSNTPDTVYVEVFRELKDTLTIVKNRIDSTTTNNYDMVSLPNVQFFTDSDKLLPSSAKDLQSLAEYLIKNDSLKATIVGHTDNTGDPKSNLNLSQRRAESVKKFLVNIGVPEANLNAVGKGDTQPKASNSTNEGRLMNRRVEVILEQNQITTTKTFELPDSILRPNTNR